MRSFAALVATAACCGAALPQPARAAPTPRPAATRIPPPPVPPGAPTLPKLSSKDAAVEVRGKILRSSRGHPGPVRLEVEKSDGGKVDVLVAPDELCNRLGLSLKAGEEVHLRGSLFNSRAPIIVTSTVIVGGQEIAVRNRGPAAPRTAAP